MQEYHYNNLKEFLTSWNNNTKYFEMLRLMAQLSKLFSDNQIPYMDYRLAENLFCKYYNATNDARSCTAYDARLNNLGIGIKTFILKGKQCDRSVEKIAEFNKLKKKLNNLSGIDLATQLGKYRNERMELANTIYNVTETQYHIVGRIDGALRIFNTPYEYIDIDKIQLNDDNDTSCSFHDDKNEYTFNKSKSVLMKTFHLPKNHVDVSVEILKDPLSLLEEFFNEKFNQIKTAQKLKKGIDYVILPLYSYDKKHGCYVPQKSGLNQFNAGGRKRNELEVYIPIPTAIRKLYPNFFPTRDTHFSLHMPNGDILSAKVCQDGGKALMSNPNKALGEWLLKKVFKKKPHEIITIEDLDRLGFNSVYIENLHCIDNNGFASYKISLADGDENYSSFISQ